MTPTKYQNHGLIISVLFGVIISTQCTIGCEPLVESERSAGLASAEVASPSLLSGKGDFVAQQRLERTFDAEMCAYDASDVYEPRARFTKGPWVGECLDTKIRRPVRVLRTPEGDDSILELANVFHNHGYWIAQIPTDAVANVYFQLEYFPAVVPAGHTQIRIEFNEPVRLRGHSAWNRGVDTLVYNLVMSAEAVPRVGESYDLFKGMQNHFGLALRVTSLSARYDSMVVEKGHHVEQWILQLTEEEKAELLTFYAYESDALGMEETYHTLFRNCTTELIRNLDGVVRYTIGENIKKFLTKGTEFYPNIIRAALIARGLLPLNQSTDWYALEEDPTFPL